MADYKVTDTELISVANAIRTKGGTQAQLEWPTGFISAIEAIPSGGVTIVPWSTGTDAEITAMIEAAHAGTIDLQEDGGWSVGDVRTINISAFTGGGVSHAAQNADIVISSFGDYNNCGCVMQIDFKNTLENNMRLNPNSGVVSYGSTEMKTTTLPALVDALPSWLKDSLIEFSVLTYAGAPSEIIETVTGNKLALRSEVEIIGTAGESKAGEGSQIPYYETSANRNKKRGQSGSNNSWWFRSPFKSSAGYFCWYYAGGYVSNTTANDAYGIAPFGCI